jgi:hypothetical protein
MRILILVPTFALLSLCCFALDITTISGKSYTNVTVSRVEPDALVLLDKKGVVRIYFSDLNDDVKQQFGYNHTNATVYQEFKRKQQLKYASARKAEHIKKEEFFTGEEWIEIEKCMNPNDPFSPKTKVKVQRKTIQKQ